MERFLRPLPLLGLAFALRAVLALWTSTLAADGAFHLITAQGFLDGRFGEVLGAYRLHPLNPVLTGSLGSVLGGVEAGGAAAGVILSSLALLPLYSLTRRFWSERIAGWTGLLYALHPTLTEEGSEVLNTGTFLFFFLAALAAGLAALETRRFALFALSGAACGLLYLTRPEGLLVPLFLVAMAAGYLRRDPKRAAAGGALAAGVGLLVAAPYLVWLRGQTGRWTLTARESVSRLVGDAPAAPASDRSPPAKITRTLLKAQFPPLVPFLLAGLALNRRLGGSRRSLAWAAALAAGTLLPSVLLLLKTGYISPSHRYLLPGVALLLPWTAAGWVALKDVAGRWGWLPVAVVALGLSAKSLGPRRADEALFREAGAWIRAQPSLPEGPLVSRGEKIPWYAGRPHAAIPFESPDTAVKAVGDSRRRFGASLFALDDDSRKRYFPEDVEPALRAAGLELLAAFERPGKVGVRLYRWTAPP